MTASRLDPSEVLELGCLGGCNLGLKQLGFHLAPRALDCNDVPTKLIHVFGTIGESTANDGVAFGVVDVFGRDLSHRMLNVACLWISADDPALSILVLIVKATTFRPLHAERGYRGHECLGRLSESLDLREPVWAAPVERAQNDPSHGVEDVYRLTAEVRRDGHLVTIGGRQRFEEPSLRPQSVEVSKILHTHGYGADELLGGLAEAMGKHEASRVYRL